jgi:Macrocin-O-methyltransferase (TylF)
VKRGFSTTSSLGFAGPVGIVRSTIRILLERALASRGFRLERVSASPGGAAVFSEDGLTTDHVHEFVRDPQFVRAYARGVAAAGEDYRIRWRTHIALWAATAAAHLPGDFVECGVNRGFLSSAIMESLDWDSLGKLFFLLDTFDGVDVSILPSRERAQAERSNEQFFMTGFYVRGVDSVRENFSEWANVRIVVGSVPASLPEVDAERVAYLHLDMNSSTPEIAALEHFWPKLSEGAVVLLDDYAFPGTDAQRIAMDAFARTHRVAIACLPTGQGMMLKPPELGG